ncbi:MAG: hypothetical protein ALECFALPRED_004612 [Alectoria fallacina]|uniref:Uncharacterized protein n=1 Tax=Alectoria fallacina TaxID=1903189 RepID=A0A8H3ISU7_9LECA|nr:MAG: hypothetical protein ALECFALPRED_004612 [Alectoria fallacina]
MNLLPWDNSASSQQSLLAGTYVFPPSVGTATPLHWSVVVGGYAYRADSLAYYLALTVLFVHAALALGHVVYGLRTRVCCDAWDSLVGLMVLAANSGMAGASGIADVFENASAGIERYRTMDTQVRVRALPTSGASAAGQEDVKNPFGDKTLAAEYRALEVDKTYGECCESVSLVSLLREQATGGGRMLFRFCYAEKPLLRLRINYVDSTY